MVEHERLAAQFLGDLDALDRLDALASQFADVDDSSRAALVQAEVASTAHRFAEARGHLARAALMGGPARPSSAKGWRSIRRVASSSTPCSLRAAASPRRAAASKIWCRSAPCSPISSTSPRRTPLYRQAFDAYDDVSPFPLAWVCFQLGVLWGELAPIPDPDDAALWYHRAIAYLPGYVKARVHLAEIYADQGDIGEAEALLLPALASRDPEVRWRLADVLVTQGRSAEAETHLEAARLRFDELLESHLLAFADHAAEFYAGSGNDPGRALELARMNVANRPTRRAVKQARGNRG